MPTDCLLIFARYPEAGNVKTRLIPALGAEGAAELYRQLAEHTLIQAKNLQNRRALEIVVWFTGGNLPALRHWLGSDLIYQPQPKGDLGERLSFAFQTAFAQGYKTAMAIGTDCPDLTSDVLDQGFQALQRHELVLGPATDGGYYLIGLQRSVPALFEDIPWSTAVVLPKTLQIADALGLTYTTLPSLSDVDIPEDLERWEQIKATPSP